MKTLYVMDPIDRIDPLGDSTYMMILDGQRRGWRAWCCTPGELFTLGGDGWARCCAVRVNGEHGATLVGGAPEELPLGDFDVVWMRKDPPFNMDYVFCTYILDLVPPRTLVLNRPAGLRNCNEKMVALRWPELCPPTLVTRDIARALAWIQRAPAKVVLKPWDGNGGRGVVVTQFGDGNLRAMLELLTDEQRTHIVVQHHIPEIVDGDKRIILIEGEPVGWMARVPQPGDHRGNMHVGAKVAGFDLSERDREICAAIGPFLKQRGLLFVGIDIIGRFMTEINVTSPTGIQEVNPLQGLTVERTLSDAIVRALEQHRAGETP
jgi:glutathione synthase